MLYSILFNDQLNAEQAIVIFIISIVVFFFSLAIHEFAHGFVAYKMGDNTPKAMGRLTLNPFKHLDPMGFLCFVIFGVGWAKPMPINPLNFKKYRKGIRWTSLAGVIANFSVGLIASIIMAILLGTVGYANVYMEYLILFLQYTMLVNSFLFMFNIIPLYPMDGFNFVSSFMKSNNKFIQFNVKNGFKIMLGILLGTTLIDVLFNFDILAWFLSLLYDYIYLPITLLGV